MSFLHDKTCTSHIPDNRQCFSLATSPVHNEMCISHLSDNRLVHHKTFIGHISDYRLWGQVTRIYSKLNSVPGIVSGKLIVGFTLLCETSYDYDITNMCLDTCTLVHVPAKNSFWMATQNDMVTHSTVAKGTTLGALFGSPCIVLQLFGVSVSVLICAFHYVPVSDCETARGRLM